MQICFLLLARPYFLNQLQNQHADIDSQLTWICNARGSPEPVYTWYKNGVKIVTDPDKRITVSIKVLVIYCFVCVLI